MRLLFDASLISEYLKSGSRRTGVYFVEYNLLRQFILSNEFELYLYCRLDCIHDLKIVLSHDEFANYNLPILNEERGLCLRLKKIWDALEKPAAGNRLIRFLRNRFYKVLTTFNDINLSKKLRSEKIEIYFSTETREIPRSIYKAAIVKKFIIVNDMIPLIFPQYFDYHRGKRHPLNRLISQLNSDNDVYSVANSENTKIDLLDYLNDGAKHRVRVSHLACSETFRKCHDKAAIESVKQKYGIAPMCRYVLSICTLEPRKNILRVIEAFIQFITTNHIEDLCLVLSGTNWERFFGILEKNIAGLGVLKEYIIVTGYVKDEDVPVLYSGAEWFVYTSQYEGFGLPPLEAMSCGCPVVASNNSSLPEVVGDAGIQINYDSIEEHVEAFKKMYFDKAFREECIRKGLEQAEKFSWKNCYETIEEYIKDSF